MICEELKYSDTFVTKNLFLSSNSSNIFLECFVLDRICENINSIIKFLFGGLKNLLNIFNATTSWELIEN